MRAEHWRRQEAHRRCYTVCLRYRRVLERTRGGNRTLTKLLSSIENVDRLSLERQRAIRGASGFSRVARQACTKLRETIQHIATVSTVLVRNGAMSLRVNVPKKASRYELVIAARVIYERLLPLVDTFEEFGLPPQVILGLPARAEAIQRANRDRDSARRDHLFGVDAIRQALTPGDDAIAVLRTILAAERGNKSKPVLELRRAQRVGSSRARKRA